MLTGLMLVVGSYLLGSVPTGLLVARLWGGVDIQSRGSKNIGATNVARVVGKAPGVITLLGDVLKGALPVLAARSLLDPSLAGTSVWVALAGLAAFVGHLYPLYLRFKGGKGVATALGLFLATAPWAVLPSAFIFVVAVAWSRYVSMGSLLGAASFPLFTALFGYQLVLVVLGVVVAVLIIMRHRENIKRLLKGEENKLGARKNE